MSRRIVGTVSFDNPELLAGIRERQHELNEDIAKMFEPYMMALDNACATVLALGYKPEQCMIIVERAADGISEKRTLEVLGKPRFEVTIEAKPIGPPDWTFEVVTTPRVIEWPPQVVP